MTKISPHLWYTDKADEPAAFHASKVEPASTSAVSMSGRVLITVTGNPRTVRSPLMVHT